ncbi:MAG: anhydro-N-acetylmuramic acid kinase [Gammaproteobacteria bacterium]|nr:anhydro-N-acetylmuramic acid kinase [Gammaproteobacteria bacterium]
MSEKYIGLTSGTSMDGVDSVLVEISKSRLKLLHGITHPFPEDIHKRTLRLVRKYKNCSLEDYGEMDTAVGGYFAQATHTLLKEAGVKASDITAIGSHGQTIIHRPELRHAFSLQIGDPNVITSFAEITTVSDFRRRDIAEGGQGAPLSSAYHEFLFIKPKETRVIINIGGIANVSVLPAEKRKSSWGFITGPGNLLLDGWSQTQRMRPVDEFGSWAATGSVDGVLLKRLMANPYFAQPAPKSTGRSMFNMKWLRKEIDADGRAIPPVDVQATLVELTARTIADSIKNLKEKPDRALVCGGGWHNDFLMQRLSELLSPLKLESTEGYGVNPDWVEAAGIAWLAHQRLKEIPIDLSTATGAERPVLLGAVYQH